MFLHSLLSSRLSHAESTQWQQLSGAGRERAALQLCGECFVYFRRYGEHRPVHRTRGSAAHTIAVPVELLDSSAAAAGAASATAGSAMPMPMPLQLPIPVLSTCCSSAATAATATTAASGESLTAAEQLAPGGGGAIKLEPVAHSLSPSKKRSSATVNGAGNGNMPPAIDTKMPTLTGSGLKLEPVTPVKTAPEALSEEQAAAAAAGGERKDAVGCSMDVGGGDGEKDSDEEEEEDGGEGGVVGAGYLIGQRPPSPPPIPVRDDAHKSTGGTSFMRVWKRTASSCARTDLTFEPRPDSALALKRAQRQKQLLAGGCAGGLGLGALAASTSTAAAVSAQQQQQLQQQQSAAIFGRSVSLNPAHAAALSGEQLHRALPKQTPGDHSMAATLLSPNVNVGAMIAPKRKEEPFVPGLPPGLQLVHGPAAKEPRLDLPVPPPAAPLQRGFSFPFLPPNLNLGSLDPQTQAQVQAAAALGSNSGRLQGGPQGPAAGPLGHNPLLAKVSLLYYSRIPDQHSHTN